MRIGLIGTGRIGTFHSAVLGRHPDVDSLVLADAVPVRAAAVAERLRAERLGAESVAEPEEVFAAGVDAVVIASATASHAELIGRAARGGLPVFCEKPIALDVAGTERALAEVAAAGTELQIGFMRRFDTGFGAARLMVGSGVLGTLHTVRAVTADPAPPPAGYLPLSGGLYRDCLVHDFDAIRWVTGREVDEVYAVGESRDPRTPHEAGVFEEAGDVHTAGVVLTLDDGTVATATATRFNGAGYDVRMELAGHLDQITVGLDDRTPLVSVEPGGPERPARTWPGFLERFAPAYERELDAFLKLVRGEIANPCDGREALEALRIAEACELSRRERRRVALAEIPGGA
ncbi:MULTISPECIES: Gfo/Idh/MocA family oxidoreductase [Streptomyces]|uniref:Dehydrogenase n=1 Tax=Streptomyces tsukubensis (strain DSM 42081 / NBRC 108919 / NRRL 18488 / 9993) TaxID=1114943 RepID=I2N905_STRT9|nr:MULTISPECIES: Gfo/Idh/MocA family oxidoreductase [Streptomyces]AZK97358.1 dehydrogenase [Streptomyces tsukubensis]EIF93502.1 Inositol 2-dehydrogenase [Streptomyces tsukubensis NRRL18488]MYS68177.1 Gfo/Idh/MocA family oxidoreductase [Streptomyces sp. SID5473]QKM66684.1 dehydrogenase [Streptomyces tsukubensis NRRL18488]TAI44969.1 dehydrogenase [Streptomyces tsukubensis]